MIKFAWPWLLCLLPLPWLLTYLFKPRKKNCIAADSALRLPFYQELVKYLEKDTIITVVNRFELAKYLLALAWFGLVLSAARPQWVGKPEYLPLVGRDIMLAIDLSGSMAQTDMGANLNRLGVVKAIADKFIDERPNDRIGLVVFGSQAFLAVPLTLDHKTVQSMLLDSQIGFAGQQTAIGDAIGLAVKHLIAGNLSGHTQVLILLSDGSNNSGNILPKEAAEIAHNYKIKIYSIGIGSERNYQTFNIKMPSDLDEEALTEIANLTEGKYFRAKDATSLQLIYERIDKIELSNNAEQKILPRKEWYFWPLSFSLLLSVVLVGLRLKF